jgi:hypothetical protein
MCVDTLIRRIARFVAIHGMRVGSCVGLPACAYLIVLFRCEQLQEARHPLCDL